MRDPLILPTVAVAAGILASHLFLFSMRDSAWPMPVFALFAFAAKSKWLRTLCISLAMLFTGAFADAWHRPGPPPKIDAGVRETVLLDGCVVEPTVFSATREQFTLELDPGARARVSFNLDDNGIPQVLNYGQRVEIQARIRPPHNYNNPGSFDYTLYLARQKIFWTAAMSSRTTAKILPGRCGSRMWSFVFALRTAAIARIEKLYPGSNQADTYSTGQYNQGMMEAILIGEKSKLEKVWTENFRRTGTYHTLVIAGFHVTILAGVLLFLLRICALNEIPALAITCAAAWLYALVSGCNAPVIRAAGGFTLYAIARFFFRRGRLLNLLCAVALVYLLYDPSELFDAAFQLSFLCVAVIGAFVAPLLQSTSLPHAQALRNPSAVDADPHLAPRVAQFRVELRLIAESLHSLTRIPRQWILPPLALSLRIALFFYGLAVLSTVVQIGLALPMAIYFHRVSFSGWSANLIVSPLMAFLVPVGFLAIFSGWHLPAALAAWMLSTAARVVDWHARMEPDWRLADPPLWLALAFIASLIALALVVARIRRGLTSLSQGGQIPSQNPPVLGAARTERSVPFAFLWLALAAVLTLFALLIWQPWPEKIPLHHLELTAIDVGQGDSLLVIFPAGARMLIDGGGLLQYGRQRRFSLDTGEDVVSPYLWSRGIRRLDIVVATHAHEDHTGGLASILENFHPRELWVGANPQQALVDRAAHLHIPVLQRHADPSFAFSGARIEILSPPADFTPSKAGNNDSLAFSIHFGARSFLLTGDMEKPMEGLLLSQRADLHADVLKVGHHGSKTSTIQPFLDAVSPSVALISDGFENSFGHPHKDVLARLRERHTAVLRTDLDGLITVRTDGRRLSFDTNHAALLRSNGSFVFAPFWPPAESIP